MENASNPSLAAPNPARSEPIPTRAGAPAPINGLAATVATIILVELIRLTMLPIVTALPILLAAVVYATFISGIGYGMVSCGLMLLYSLYYLSGPGEPFQYTREETVRLLTLSVVTPSIVLMVGVLKRRAERASEALRAKSVLETQLLERQRAGQALQQAHDSLEARVAERTTELLRLNENFRNEIAERRRVEDALGERARHAALTGDIGVALTQGVDLHGTLQRCAEVLVKHLDAAFARIWVLNAADNVLELMASAGMYTHLDGRHSRILVGQLKIGWIAEQRKPHLTNELLGDPRVSDQEWVQKEGMAAFAGYPLVIGERLLGVMGIFSRRRLSQATTAAMGAVADAVALGIDRKRKEEAVRESELRLQAILDYTTAVIYLKDPDGRYLLINRRFEELFHVSRDKIVGQTDYDMFPPETADAFRANDRRVLEVGTPLELEEVVPQDDGVHIYISVKFPIYDLLGRTYGVCGISTDITDRKRTETALQNAKEAAEAASRTKSEFLAKISHEIRTPIMAMLSAAELLDRPAGRAPQESGHVDIILRNGRHLLSLIDDLLDVSRVEAGKLDIRPVQCSSLDLLADVQAVTMPLQRQPQVDFRFFCETELPSRIHTDPLRFKQAVINVISNALKFTSAGHVHVRVRAERGGDASRLVVAVDDTGVGIAPSDVERAFESFTQLQVGTARLTSGVGLGLPLAKWIVEQLGGALTVESEAGRGSTFTISVPVGPLDGVDWIEAQNVFVPRRLEAPSPAGAGVCLRGSILLADDHADVAAVMKIALENAGAHVTVVENGRDAVQVALARRFDLILMDIRMPTMDGLSATRELRRLGCRSPIIAVTASTTRAEREYILQAGFDDLWPKPLSLKQLVENAACFLNSATAEPADNGRDAQPIPLTSPANARLAAAIQEFVLSLGPRVARVRAAVDAGKLGEACEVLHQLAGAGGIHGYMTLSHEAARLLTTLKADSSRLKPQELQPLEALVAELTRSIGERTAMDLPRA